MHVLILLKIKGFFVQFNLGKYHYSNFKILVWNTEALFYCWHKLLCFVVFIVCLCLHGIRLTIVEKMYRYEVMFQIMEIINNKSFIENKNTEIFSRVVSKFIISLSGVTSFTHHYHRNTKIKIGLWCIYQSPFRLPQHSDFEIFWQKRQSRSGMKFIDCNISENNERWDSLEWCKIINLNAKRKSLLKWSVAKFTNSGAGCDLWKKRGDILRESGHFDRMSSVKLL